MAGVVLRSGNGSGICLNMSSASPPSVRSYRSSGVRAPHRHVIRSGELLPVPVTLTSLFTAVCAVVVLSAAGPKRGGTLPDVVVCGRCHLSCAGSGCCRSPRRCGHGHPRGPS